MKKIELCLERFTEKIRQVWEDNLVSVILYGSYLKEEFIPGVSDINLVVLTSKIDLQKLLLSRKTVLKFNRKYRIVPVFFTVDFFQSSFDSFALEWKEIKEGYKVLFGRDLIRKVEIKKEHLLFQIEREIKEDLIRFQQGLLFDWNLETLLLRSGRVLQIIYRNLKDIYAEKEIAEAAAHLKIIEELRRKKVKLNKQRLKELAEKHLLILNQLVKIMEEK